MVFSFNLVCIEKFGCHGYLINCKVTSVNQGVMRWLSNDKKTTSQIKLELRCSKSSCDVVRGF